MASQYSEKYKKGETVRVVSSDKLEQFLATWAYHHKLTLDQLAFAGRVGEVEDVFFYHGGDVLYKLREIPEVWHEVCLEDASA